MSMRAKPWDVSDGLWERIEPLLPKRERRFRYPGRKPYDDRLALQGILFVLHTVEQAVEKQLPPPTTSPGPTTKRTYAGQRRHQRRLSAAHALWALVAWT